MKERKVVSKSSRTTTNADGTRKVVTVVQYNDGSRGIITDELPPRDSEAEPQPVEPPVRAKARPDVSFDEESQQGLSYVSLPTRSNGPGPVNTIFVDGDDEDISVMESLYEHPVLVDDRSFPVGDNTQQPPQYSEYTTNAQDTSTRVVNPDESGLAGKETSASTAYNNLSAGWKQHKWIILAVLLLTIVGCGVGLCVFLGYRSYANKVSNSGATVGSNEQAIPSLSPMQSEPLLAEPTNSPPSRKPSIVISPEPSLTPTKSPTTQRPSIVPTTVASSNPTLQPSFTPSSSLSLAPSLAPSLRASLAPTSAPSLRASLAPTSAPSLRASLAPTSAPSLSVSLTPTSAPSLKVTLMPSLAPTTSMPSTTSAAPVVPSTPSAPTFSSAPVVPPPSASPTAPQTSTTPETSSSVATCKDTVGWVDSNNASCEYYETNGCGLSFLSPNNAGVSAWGACCACGGGNQDFVDGDPSTCQDYLGFVDNTGDTCDWYSQNDACDTAALSANSLGVSALQACCACAGGSFNNP